MDIKHIDTNIYPPTKEGMGRAWKIDIEAIRKEKNIPEDGDATVAMWIVFAPWANIMWSYYIVAAIHLRPCGQLSNPKINLPGATHECWVMAMDPRETPDLSNPIKTMLRPMNFVGQWIVQERNNPVDLDKKAAAKIEECVDDILKGHLSPDTDFRRQWVLRFSDSNILA